MEVKKKEENIEIIIATMNVKSLNNEEQLTLLRNALDNINGDIMGISKVKRLGEHIFELENGVIFAFIRETMGLHGVEFLVRVAYALVVYRVILTLRFLTVYAPKSKILSWPEMPPDLPTM